MPAGESGFRCDGLVLPESSDALCRQRLPQPFAEPIGKVSGAAVRRRAVMVVAQPRIV